MSTNFYSYSKIIYKIIKFNPSLKAFRMYEQPWRTTTYLRRIYEIINQCDFKFYLHYFNSENKLLI